MVWERTLSIWRLGGDNEEYGLADNGGFCVFSLSLDIHNRLMR
jgi:hypothetical protein